MDWGRCALKQERVEWNAEERFSTNGHRSSFEYGGEKANGMGNLREDATLSTATAY